MLVYDLHDALAGFVGHVAVAVDNPADGAAGDARQFGDHTPFVIDSLTLPGVTRGFTTFSEAARENAASRVYCGIHWRTSTFAGLEQGDRIGEHVFEHQLQPACNE